MLAKTAELIQEFVDSAKELYQSSAPVRAICVGMGLLGGLLGIDALTGFSPGLRMAYVLPVWLATKRGGRTAGGSLVLATTLFVTLIDLSHGGRQPSFLVNFAVQTIVLYLLMLIFESVENRLRDVTTLASRDPLTGLSNRLSLEEKGKSSVDRATVLGQPLTVAMIDCDRFKELNDRFGHTFGDDVLRILSKCLRRSMPADAIVGRTGGDEFIVILPNRDHLQAQTMLEVALDRFMSHAEIVGRSGGFSFGVASLGAEALEFDRLIEAADRDMYRRKSERALLAMTMAS